MDIKNKQRIEDNNRISQKQEMSLCMRKPTSWVPTRSGTNRAEQSQNKTRSLKLWI